MNRKLQFVLGALLVCCAATVSQAGTITFGSGPFEFAMEFVDIGDPGNQADTTGIPNPAGSVGYAYSISKFEVSRFMVNRTNLPISMHTMSFVDGGPRSSMPATGVSWYDAAKFVNYLNADKGHAPAYKFDDRGNFVLWEPGDPGYDSSNLFRSSLAKYALPSADEWYKAAYYDGTGSYFDYATASNTPPLPVADGTSPGTAVYNLLHTTGPADISRAGGPSALGTVGQNGNAIEWQETASDGSNDSRIESRMLRGGSWGTIDPFRLSSSFRNGASPGQTASNSGFRVVSLDSPAVVPEPGSFATFSALGVAAIHYRRKRQSAPRILVRT